MDIQFFKTDKVNTSIRKLFTEFLNIPLQPGFALPSLPGDILKNNFRPASPVHSLIDDIYFAGIVDDLIFAGKKSTSTIDMIREGRKDYDGLLIFGVKLKKRNKGLLPTRSQMAEITRLFNREFCYTPVLVIFEYDGLISLSNCERVPYKIQREGEKTGKVTMLKDVNILHPHAAHLKILTSLVIDPDKINSFQKLYKYWQTVFSIQALNDQFYSDLQDWFYYAIKHIKLPFKPDYIDEHEHTKNFLVRLLARLMFCWFLKEKGLIKSDLFELSDWEGNKYPLTKDVEEPGFLKSNSYYRGILQNIFFNSLNQIEKKTKKDFKWTKYISEDFNYEWFYSIPYLNGGIFDKLEEDNAKESIEDSVLKIPNYLFYGITKKEKVSKGRGHTRYTEIERVEHKGLNGIFKSYKFTLEENTPFEIDIALDPELLGLVFENLLAELDPNLEESTIKSIRKLTGSYYTPRKIIQEMVNESLFLYLSKFFETNNMGLTNYRKLLSKLVYHNTLGEFNNVFCSAVVHALDKYKVLDPACGSGAFPMGMLHRIVEILKLVDPKNERWLELKLKSVDSAQRNEFKKLLSKHMDDYGRKLGIIRDSIYGIDIQPLAVQITKLRFFISLLIDQQTEKGITPMPNIETKIICADSLKNILPDLFAAPGIPKLREARDKYYQPDLTSIERTKITDEIVSILDEAFPFFAREITGKEIKGQNKELLKEWFNHATIAAPFFNMDFFFPELKESGGFDCVIGNPPYGGIKISDEVKDELFLESKDPYGAFIARFLSNFNIQTPLKNGGVLAFIVSDTFMTIKSHLPLRKMMMQNYIHKMLRVHPDTFRATVNTSIIICERNMSKNRKEDHVCQMSDMTNISIHENYEHFIEVMEQSKGVDFQISDTKNTFSNKEYAIYYYPQNLISTNSNMPFFVSSPKIFALMNDCGRDLKKEIKDIGGKNVQVRKIWMNNKDIPVVKLEDIAEVKVGLQTGDNDAYLFQNPDSRGTYRSIEDFKAYLLTEKELEKIRRHSDIRLKVIDKGISKNNIKSDHYFGGRYIVPYDKGGESDAEGGWMPNYFVPTNYYIDWSEQAIKRMKTYTIAQRIREYKENKQIKSSFETTTCAVFRSPERYFTDAISFSRTGVYSPTFRLGSIAPFDTEGSMIFQNYFSNKQLLGILTSVFIRYLLKNYIGHTVHAQVEELKELPIPISTISLIETIVKKIIQAQQDNPRYDYASHEQIEINRIVYETYGLNVNDIEEVENWYKRRYPKLSAAQKENLRNLGRSDDYLVLYGFQTEKK